MSGIHKALPDCQQGPGVQGATAKLLCYLKDFKSTPRKASRISLLQALCWYCQSCQSVLGLVQSRKMPRKKKMHYKSQISFYWGVTLSLSWATLERLHLHYHSTGWVDFPSLYLDRAVISAGCAVPRAALPALPTLYTSLVPLSIQSIHALISELCISSTDE